MQNGMHTVSVPITEVRSLIVIGMLTQAFGRETERPKEAKLVEGGHCDGPVRQTNW